MNFIKNKYVKNPDDVSWLEEDNWKDAILTIITNYKKRTGKKVPSYDEMLKLGKAEFQAFLFLKTRPKYQDETIKEMVEHEERTKSATKRMDSLLVERGRTGQSNKDISEWDSTDWSLISLKLFQKENSEEIGRVLRKMHKVVQDIDQTKKQDLIEISILAKANEDYVEYRNMTNSMT